MGRLLKNLKSIFVIESKSDRVVETSDKPVENPKQETAASIPVLEKKAKVSKKFTEILFKAIEDNNQEGYDYLEFKQSLQNLKSLNMDEATRYKSAFASAQPLGATLDGLVNSAQYYQKVLDAEEKKFADALRNQRTKKIEARKVEIENAQKSIEQKRKEIEQLKSQIQSAEAQLQETQTEVSDTEVRFQRTQQQFDADVDKIKQYLT
jgi:chromosome segregation ATPase